MKKKSPKKTTASQEKTEAPIDSYKRTFMPWTQLDLFTADTSSIPAPAKNENDIFQPCFLYRGSSNLLTRFDKEVDSNEKRRGISQEVRATAASWLKMQNVVVMMGAGTSAYITGFVGSGLFEATKKVISGRESLTALNDLFEHASNPEQIGQQFERFLSQVTTLINLSNVALWPMDKIPVDVPLRHFRDAGRRKKALANLLSDLERAIAVVCNVKLPDSLLSLSEEEEPTPHEVFLAKLVERDPQCGRGRIFTLNYDTLLEQAMDRLRILYCDGFTGTVHRRFNPSAYDLDVHYPGEATEGRVRRYDKFLHLYKLHGSINWRRSTPTAMSPFGITFDPSPLPGIEVISRATEKGQDLLSNIFKSQEGLAILPTSGKFAETLAMPYAHLFRCMGQALRESQTVLFIMGYSGWDAHVNQLIQDALSNPGFTCVIVDPLPSEWARNLCQLDKCGRVYCFGGHWGSFEFFAKEVLPDIEVLKTDIEIARTLRDLEKSRTADLAPQTKSKIGEGNA